MRRRNAFRAIMRPPILRRSIIVALIVGAALNLINQGDALLDAWVFSGNTTPVRDVMAGGRWVVRDGIHHRQAEIASRFARAMRRIRDLA